MKFTENIWKNKSTPTKKSAHPTTLSTQVKNAVSCIHRPSRVFEQIANWPLPSIAINARPSTPILQAAPLDNKEWKMCPIASPYYQWLPFQLAVDLMSSKKNWGGWYGNLFWAVRDEGVHCASVSPERPPRHHLSALQPILSPIPLAKALLIKSSCKSGIVSEIY